MSQPSFLEMLQDPHVLLTFDKVHNPLRLPRETIWTSKSGLYMVCFVHFDFEMFFARHNGVHFFDISTSKTGPNVRCF